MKRISPLIDPAARRKHRMVGITVFVLSPLAWVAVIAVWRLLMLALQ